VSSGCTNCSPQPSTPGDPFAEVKDEKTVKDKQRSPERARLEEALPGA